MATSGIYSRINTEIGKYPKWKRERGGFYIDKDGKCTSKQMKKNSTDVLMDDIPHLLQMLYSANTILKDCMKALEDSQTQATKKDAMVLNLQEKLISKLENKTLESSSSPSTSQQKENGKCVLPTAREKARVKSDNLCNACGVNCGSDTLSCFICKESYHAVKCANSDGDLATATFLKTFTPAFQKSYPGINFVCTFCREDLNMNRDFILANRLEVMEERFTQLVSEVSEMNKHIQENPQKQNVSIKSSYAKVLTYSSDVPESIVLESKITESDVKSELVNQGVQVKRQYINPSGKQVLVFPNKKEKEKFIPIAQHLKPGAVIKEPRPKEPVITIAGFTEEYSKQDLVDQIKEQNPELAVTNDNFKPLFFTKTRSDDERKIAVIRVSNELRSRLSTNHHPDTLYLGLSSYRIRDRFYVKRCNCCQGLGHWHADEECSKDIKCSYCGDSHDSRQCPNKSNTSKHRCINCESSGYSSNHMASSPNCPSLLKMQEKLKMSIPFHQAIRYKVSR